MFVLNVFLSNGDVFDRRYVTADEAKDAFDRLARNALVTYASLHDEQDNEIAVIDRGGKPRLTLSADIAAEMVAIARAAKERG